MGSQAAFMQNQLSFSRDMEREADRIGFGVMTQAGYAPQGAAAMFEKLQYASRLNDNGSYPYLRSHPLNSERVADMQGRYQFRPGSGVTMPLAMDHAMIAARARVLVRPGVDVLRLWIDAAGSGEFARSTPAQQAGTLYAAALAANELRDHKSARALVQRLMVRTSEDAPAARLARLLSAEIELAADDAPKAATLLDLQARDRPEMLLTAQAAAATRSPKPMVAPLRDWVASHPRDATAWRMLGRLYGAQNDTLRAIRADAEANVAVLDYPGARDRFKAAQEFMHKGGAPIDHYEASIVDTRARAIEVLVKEQAAEPPLK
jgi:predicted Zn-dependent protease